MQRAAFRDPPAMFLTVSPYSPPVTVIEYGAGAALFNCGITAGVGFYAVPLISLLIVLSGVLARCSLLCMVFFFSSLMFCSCYSGAAYGGKSTTLSAQDCIHLMDAAAIVSYAQTLTACLRPPIPPAAGCELFPLFQLLSNNRAVVIAQIGHGVLVL